MIRRPISTFWIVFLGVLSIGLLLAGYTWLSERQHRQNPDDTTIPTWSQLKEGVHDSVMERRRGERWVVEDAKATLKRLFMGLGLGIVSSIILGLLMGCFPRFEAFLLPPLALLAKIPPIALLPVFFVLMGTGMKMFIAMIAFGVLPVMAQAVYLGVRDVPKELLYKASTLGASQVELIWNVIVRAILPRLIDSVRLQIGPAMVYLIAAEMMVSDVGFGYRIRLQMKLLDLKVVYPYLIMLAAFGFALDYGLRFLQRIVCPWYEGKEG